MKAKILTLAILGLFLVGCGGEDGNATTVPDAPLPPQQVSLKAVFPDHLLDQTATDQMQVILDGSHNFVIGATNKQMVQIMDESSVIPPQNSFS